uniref:Zona pellucida sperm-binding protein 4 n=1 Tax=Anabas testudineus TaxID=64144 RepID=A0A7N6AE56_ANATE
MGKLWSATSLVALTLLACLALTEVEAQNWQTFQETARNQPSDPWHHHQSSHSAHPYPRTASTGTSDHSSDFVPGVPTPILNSPWPGNVPQWTKVPVIQPPPVITPAKTPDVTVIQPPKVKTPPQWPGGPVIQPPKVPPKWPVGPVIFPPKVIPPPKQPVGPVIFSPKVIPSPKQPVGPVIPSPQVIMPPKQPDVPVILPPKIITPPKQPVGPIIPPTKVITPPKWPVGPVIQPPQVITPPQWPTGPVIQPPNVITPPKQPTGQITQPKVPQKPTAPKKPVVQPPPQEPIIQSCDVIPGLRVPCGVPGITGAACNAISCCFDGQQCYFGKAVTVQCTKDAQFIVVVARDATLPYIDLGSISLLGAGAGCTNVDSNSGFAIYQFPVTACGTTVTEEPGIITYENRMTSSYEVGVGPLGSITRDSYYDLLFQCRYIGSSVETVVVEVMPPQEPLSVFSEGPITVVLRLANGQCTAKGCNELDVAYTSYYQESDYPITKVLRDPVYVEVQLTQKTDPNLVLTLGRCWTTTTPTPHSLPQWDILINGCPYKDDRYLTTLVPVDSSSGLDFPTHYRRFIFQMFTFVDSSSAAPLKENVYIHCSTTVCTPGPGTTCEPSCGRKKREAVDENQKNLRPNVVVSAGPVIIWIRKFYILWL